MCEGEEANEREAIPRWRNGKWEEWVTDLNTFPPVRALADEASQASSDPIVSLLTNQ